MKLSNGTRFLLSSLRVLVALLLTPIVIGIGGCALVLITYPIEYGELPLGYEYRTQNDYDFPVIGLDLDAMTRSFITPMLEILFLLLAAAVILWLVLRCCGQMLRRDSVYGPESVRALRRIGALAILLPLLSFGLFDGILYLAAGKVWILRQLEVRFLLCGIFWIVGAVSLLCSLPCARGPKVPAEAIPEETE